MARKDASKRLQVTHLRRIKGTRFGPLVTRAMPDGGLLGDVSILHEHLPPRTTLPTVHHVRTTEFVYCTAGTMRARLDGRTYRLRAGSVIIIPPGVRHRFSTGDAACEAISVFRPALAIGPGADLHIDP